MKLTKELLELREAMKQIGDNIEIAAIASSLAGEVVSPRTISNAFSRKQAKVSVVKAIQKFYGSKVALRKEISKSAKKSKSILKSLSNLELAQ